ncbi:MAG TPA: nucleotide exchange factor GrpE [Pirellulales bacterium]|nr:nucleotide exchange factor GrpE [Pirellulales bacterium]
MAQNDPKPETDELAEHVADVENLDPQAEIEQLRREANDAQDRYLRAQAELENFRKRARRELDEERKYAFMPLLKDILPIVDNLERALEASQTAPDPTKVLAGIKMVAQQFEEVLARHGATRINAQGQPFDPNLHQAILHQSAADQPAETVLQVTQPGFQLHDRVIRPAQVIVSKAP